MLVNGRHTDVHRRYPNYNLAHFFSHERIGKCIKSIGTYSEASVGRTIITLTSSDVCFLSYSIPNSPNPSLIFLVTVKLPFL